MKMYTPEGLEAEVAPNQVEILLGAGWTKEKPAETKEAKDTEVEVEEKKLKRLLKPKE